VTLGGHGLTQPPTRKTHRRPSCGSGERETVLGWAELFLDAHPVGTKLAGGYVSDVSIAEPGLTKPRIVVTVKAAGA
jgi:hypothetical protein